VTVTGGSRLNRAARKASIAKLHVGAKTRTLIEAGVETLGDVLAWGEYELWKIPTIGSATTSTIAERLQAVDAVVTTAGDVDWDAFAVEAGFRLLPERHICSGAELIDAIPTVVSDLILSFPDEVDRVILRERLSKPPHEQMTLDAIARSVSGSLSRERVRQRERDLLTGISEALLFDDPNGLDVHFRASFAAFWKSAARAFGNRASVSLEELVARLARVWDVPIPLVLERLPLIVAILTNKSQLPASLRPRPNLDRRLFGDVSEESLETPIERLALGKYIEDLNERGIESVGELIEAAKWNRVPAPTSAPGRAIDLVLSAIAQSLDSDGDVDWATYAAVSGLAKLPADEPRSPLEFLAHLNDTIEQILFVNRPTSRAAEIYRIRTGLPAKKRPTLAETAELLATHGPTIKREETILLAALNEQLIDRDFTYSRVHFTLCFLAYWKEAYEVYEACDEDFDMFQADLAAKWDISIHDLDRHGAGLWAILNLYPQGRRRARSNAASRRQGEASAGETIVLRGFQRLH
jgi:hypothetical protein